MSADMSNPPTMRRWPTGTEYAEAVQQPRQSFSDAELSGGQLTLTPLGLPAMASGQSAVAFHFQPAAQQVAVRCLLSAHDDGRQRYQALESHLAKQTVSAVVPARWIDEDWVRNAQTQRIAGVPDAHEAIRVIEEKEMFVGLTERFDESMVLLKALKADDLDISYAHVNVAKRNTVAAGLLYASVSRAPGPIRPQ